MVHCVRLLACFVVGSHAVCRLVVALAASAKWEVVPSVQSCLSWFAVSLDHRWGFAIILFGQNSIG